MYSKLSIVIPIYNELENVKNIVRQLDSIGKDNFEVIFVDGYRQSDSDLLRDIIGPKCKYIRSGKGRGLQMNKGFEMAKHDLILFLHCDSSIELRMVDDIISSANRGVEFGCMSIYFNDSRILMKICGFMSRFRAKKRKIAFGDQGVFFTRYAFEKLGGYKEIGIMEDYDISIRAKGVYDLVQIDTRIVTSSRRFYTGKGRFNKPPLTDIGILMVMRDMQVFQRAYRRGIDPDIIVKRYYKH
ncbi:N-glycosyltransferase [Peptostreptococcus anaerobius]|uniref:4,4'-diaponeurosporenoate glycosyltransferase n=2 Tax=Peptostreptococcus anaerobius TaxID=1261 RepID=A0A379CGY9_9FIRM|nr:glycosyltransferase family 2 protein [Peptostreptococcus anaerobius]SFM71352.1 transferase 2, rSAM/selenodomain-associated [Peptostreptococcus anaerobius]SUB60965.1 N-glycosyltransferase [Peptostreptococcus anaerobius]